MLVDVPLQHEVEGRVDKLVEEVKELDSKQVELVEELVIKEAEEVAELTKRMEALTKSMTLLLSQNDNAVDDKIHEDDRNVNVDNGRNGCSYKDFVACKPKEFDGKGGAVAYIRWVDKMEAIQHISGCGDNQKVKYSAGSLTGRALTWWNSEVRNRGREDVVGMTWEDFKALMKEEYCLSNEMQRLETEFWNHAMVGAGQSTYLDRFHELARLVPHLVTPETKRIERLNREPGQGGNRPNQAMAIERGYGRGKNGNPARGRAFMMGAEEARQDPNIMTGTFSLNNHYATMLFDSGADYSFV
ncbi:reverse transcriptase domain-containing protein, partial [Tanacetum coccineum]